MADESSTPDAGTAPDAGAGTPPPVAAAEPAWHEGLITKDAAGAESLADPASWLDKAPKPLGDFVRSQMTAARAKTEGMLKVPAPDAPPEEFEAFYKGIGRPDTPEGYEMKPPEKLPEGVKWDDNLNKQFKVLAHEIGLTPKQTARLMEEQIKHVGETTAADKMARDAAMAESIAAEKVALKTKFGETLPDTCLIAQQAAGKKGIKADCFRPDSGEFWGVEALDLVSDLARENARLKMEDRGSNQGASPLTSDYQYAVAVSTGKHPDYAKYRAGDPEITAKVNKGWKEMPKSEALQG